MPQFITPVAISSSGMTGSAWNTVDLSAYIPTNAVGVIVNIHSTTTGTVVGARKYGSTDNLWGYLSGPNYNVSVLSGVSTDRKIDFYSNTSAGILNFWIIGYFTSDEAVFFTNVVSKGVMPGSYTTYSIASDVGSNPAMGAILYTDSAYYFFARHPSSSDDLSVNSAGIVSQIVGVNSAKQFQATALLSPTLYVMGYIKKGMTWNTNAIDRTPATTAAFTPITPSSASSAVMALVRGPTRATLRNTAWTGYDPYSIPSNTNDTQFHVPKSLEAKLEDATLKLWEQGYFRPANGIVLPDAFTPYSLLATGESSSSFSHTVGTGPNRLLLVALHRGTGYGNVPTSVTFGGVAMTYVGTQQNGSWGTEQFLYQIINPPSGTATVAVNWGVFTRGGITASSFSSVDQTSPLYNFTGTTGLSTSSASITSAAAGDMAVDFVDSDNGDTSSLKPTAGQFQRIGFIGGAGAGGSSHGIGVSTKQWPAGSVTMSWSGFVNSANAMTLMIKASVAAYVVQTIDYGSTTAASSIVTGTYYLTAGNRVAFWAMFFASSDISTSCTDTNGNTWNKVTGSAYTNGGVTWIAWECKNVTVVGDTQITVSLSASSAQRAIAGVEIWGLSPTASVQATASNSQTAPGTATDAVTTGNVTPTEQPAMLLAMCQMGGATGAISAGTGFTVFSYPNAQVFNGGSTTVIEYKRVTSLSPVAATFTVGTGTLFTYLSFGLIISEPTIVIPVNRLGIFDPQLRIQAWF